MATTSSTGATTFTTPSDREIAATRVFDAPRRLVYEAHTNPKHLPNWMLGPEGWTMPVCEIDLRPGGAWHFVWRKADGSEMAMRGTYKEVVPPEKVVTTESWGGDWPETINTLTLTEKDGKTILTSTILYPSKDARDAALKTGMKQGMNVSFDRLAAYLQGLA
ncbi:MAG TPA: SRPBCC family protein [Gemmatimonadaceae bacterium]|nr:SRPBCC family protein [Gemmatimonadaceae bacterium]